MHIFFSGIGGTAIGPLAMIAKQAGYDVSGSDKQQSQYIDYLRKHGIADIHIGQTAEAIEKAHQKKPIDWYVYSSAVKLENPNAPELKFCQENNIRTSKRDELLNQIIKDKNLKLIAVAGTHGKTTTTAMIIWLFKQLGIPVSYSVGAKIPFGEMGQYAADSEYFVYEADEFDRNFLAFQPYLSIITGIAWDHHEQYPNLENYKQAFLDFLANCTHVAIWEKDRAFLNFKPTQDDTVIDKQLSKISLLGEVNRQNAYIVATAAHGLGITDRSVVELGEILGKFPGLSRRFERIKENLYSDYAHTPEKIKGALQTASELSKEVVVVYEPLTDRRQHYIKDAYHDLFHGVKKLYWVPSYLAREDPKQPVLTPAMLISHMANKDIARPARLDENLKEHIQHHLKQGDLVVCMSGGGGGSLDEWLRQEFKP